VVIMNPQISLDIFIPPSPKFDHVNVVYTRDHNGLNNGVFLIKVNVWSVRLLSGVLSFHTFRPEKELKYSEQSALEEMVVRDVSYADQLSLRTKLQNSLTFCLAAILV
jgi:hypothetical protein